MKKKIFYWSPCLNPVGTVKSTLNSALSLAQYGKNNFDVTIINAFGEWDQYLELFEKNNIKIVNFKKKFYKFLPKVGYIQSRVSYLIIYIFCFLPLLRLIKTAKPDYLIAHLITSLPLTIMSLFSSSTKYILRISGMPKLNFIRKNFWKLISKNIFLVTCPTLGLKSKLIKINLFNKEKIKFLPDAILDIKNNKKQSLAVIDDFKKFENKKLIIAAGRLTKQKNFSYLLDEFCSFSKENDQFILLILGEGEERKHLEQKILEKGIKNKAFLVGNVDNVSSYFRKSEIFVLSSLWEDPGFVMMEAAINNLYVIASDCPNGPIEFLNNGKNGILFSSNIKDKLYNSLIEYNKLTERKKFIDKCELKKNSKKYTKFRHFIELNKILMPNICVK